MDVLKTLWEALSGILSIVFSFLLDCANALFSWLPDDPFTEAIASFQAVCSANSQAIGWLNWFFPVPLFVSVLGLLAACLVVWVAYLVALQVLDWIKTIKQTINPGG